MAWKEKIRGFDESRDIAIIGTHENTLDFCVEHFIEISNEAIADHDYFAVALAGGSTPKAIYQKLAEHSSRINWKKVLLFWSDERSVPPTDPESNYRMAMIAGFERIPIPSENIFRMKGEGDIEKHAKEYNDLIRTHIPLKKFDLIMLGVGDDGHTASLFPFTHGLHTADRLAIANYVPQKKSWRMTLTFQCINAAHHIAIYVLGASKASIIKKTLCGPFRPDDYPVQRVGTATHKALWIMDQEAASEI